MGVAIILNKRTTKWQQANAETVVRGRAMLVSIPWSQEMRVTCLAVYALNQPRQNKEFWKELERRWKAKRWEKPTCVLGDFNVIKDSADWLPPHNDPPNTVRALTSLKTHLEVIDGWRRETPEKIDHTFRTKNSTTQSWIDWIYINEGLLKYTHNWKIEQTGIQTDHLLAHMSLINPWTPHQGAGRYTMPFYLLEHKSLMTKIHEHAKKYYKEMQVAETVRTHENNPQIVHKKMKEEML